MKKFFKSILIVLSIAIGVLIGIPLVFALWVDGGATRFYTKNISYEHKDFGTLDSRYYIGLNNVYYKHNSIGPTFKEIPADSDTFVVLTQSLAKDEVHLFINETAVEISADRRPFEVVSCRDNGVFPDGAPQLPKKSLWDAKGDVYKITEGYFNEEIGIVLDPTRTVQEEKTKDCTILPLSND